MKMELEAGQAARQREFREFVDLKVAPFAEDFDEQGRVPEALIQEIAAHGYLAANISQEHAGRAWDAITGGLLCEQFGRGSCSLLSLLVVHGMVAQMLGRWGTPSQQQQWLPRLAAGKTIAAFALSEPGVGSDAGSVQTTAINEGGCLVLNGVKTWSSFGQRADLFLIFAQGARGVSALLVERGTPGLSVTPLPPLAGFRAAQLARLDFQDCRVPEANLISRQGFGFTHVASSALDYGRHCIAWGSVGLAQGCLEAATDYASRRIQFGKPLKEHPLIQEMLTNMITRTRAARALCCQEAYSRQTGNPEMLLEAAVAKYFAAQAASQIAADAVQIHGANGLTRDYPVQRYFRDAKVMELIEGSNQMQQMLIARNAG